MSSSIPFMLNGWPCRRATELEQTRPGVAAAPAGTLAVVRFGSSHGEIEWHKAELIAACEPVSAEVSAGKRVSTQLRKALDEALGWAPVSEQEELEQYTKRQAHTAQTIARLHRRALQRRLGLRKPHARMFEVGWHEFDFTKTYTTTDLNKMLKEEQEEDD
jgi:hypothetical protein